MIILEALAARINRRDGEMTKSKRTKCKWNFHAALKTGAYSYLRGGGIFVFPLCQLVYLTLLLSFHAIFR